MMRRARRTYVVCRQYHDGTGLAPLLIGSQIMLSFGGDGIMDGNTGCSSYFTWYSEFTDSSFMMDER